MEKEKKDNDVY